VNKGKNKGRKAEETLAWLGRFFAGMELGFHPDDIEDLSEP
jgi:hypothetical protein